MPIQVLDQGTINKIAAGEVIDRPSSVVKELMENAIDARATAITVEIKDGGISFIRITDNGCGIEKKEIPMAFLRHSTSKIKSAEDLLTVSSLGFRGEALSSIAAVSQVELITKTPGSLTGCRYLIEGGKEHLVEEVGAPDGTTFIVRNLFYNTPARRKFLKTATTEAGYISDLVERIALSHPDISIRFISNNQNKLHTAGNDNLKDILYHVYGRDIARNLLDVDISEAPVSMKGFIGKPIVSRGNRNFENYFINGRFIKSNIINRAIEEAYKPYMMLHRYPFVALHFTIDQSLIDVNVHPSKMELRIQNSEEVYKFICKTLSDVLAHKEYIPSALDGEKRAPVIETRRPVRAAEPFETRRMAQETKPQIQTTEVKPVVKSETMPIVKQEPAATGTFPASVIREPEGYVAKPRQMSIFDDAGTNLLDLKNVKAHKIIGQLFATYWLVEFEDRLFIIDQHAAHEKVLYERLMRRMEQGERLSQNLLPPFVLSLGLSGENVLKENMDVFLEMGFEIEHFGGREYAVSAVPVELFGMNEKELFTEVLDELASSGTRTNESIKDRIATMACKAAVKGHDQLSVAEARALIDQLLLLENPYNCPHGRPTIIQMSKHEIEKKFKRIV